MLVLLLATGATFLSVKPAVLERLENDMIERDTVNRDVATLETARSEDHLPVSITFSRLAMIILSVMPPREYMMIIMYSSPR